MGKNEKAVMNQKEQLLFDKYLSDLNKQPECNDVEEKILNMFREELSTPNLEANDNFFDMGGHSLLATRIIGKLFNNYNTEITINDFFEAPTAKELAALVSPKFNLVIHNTTSEKKYTQNANVIAPLSLLQKVSLKTIFEYGRNTMFNIPLFFKVSEGRFNEKIFKQAFTDVLKRHHALRTIFLYSTEDKIIPLQKVLNMEDLSVQKWFWFSDEQGQLNYYSILVNEVNNIFDLFSQIPVRVKFLKGDQGEQIVSIVIYHLALDEWSIGILLKDLLCAYRYRLMNQEPEWDFVATQFHEYVIQNKNQEVTQEQINYWKNTLGELKKSNPLFGGHQKLANNNTEPDFTGSSINFRINSDVIESLHSLAKQTKASLFHVIYSSIAISLYLLNAGKNVVIESPLSGRENSMDFLETIGIFTTSVIHKINFDEELTIYDLITQVKNKIIESIPYSNVPISMIEDAVRHEEETSRDNLCEYFIQLHPHDFYQFSCELLDDTAIKFNLLEIEKTSSFFGLHFMLFEELVENKKSINFQLVYRTSNYTKEQINLIKDVCQKVILQLAKIKDKNEKIMYIRKALSNL